MSDPVTNVEIEDVLASIKRLVSEESRSETAVPETPGKLVLTPALRVAAPDVNGPDVPRSGPAPVSEPPLYSPMDDLYSEDTEEPMRVESAELEACFADAAEDEDQDDVVEFRHSGDDKDADKDADTEQPEDVSETGDWDSGQTVNRVDAVQWEDVEDADYETIEDDAEDDLPEAEAIETSSYGDAAEPQDDAPHDHGYTGGSDDLDDLAAVSADEDAILDEDALRELVADIVRQELQGALGERITRNVRKLVRREIHRALTSHELQ
ncbi:hypothetical protein [Thalassovita sp.]|uniref:hypothetical protein n=1 Tax=Thalassovita sp. TaxID=1979401 RepID=UPI002B27A95E|nr:hypothetical protein [Thalassovita sp.]